MTSPDALRRLVDEAYERGCSLDLATAVYGPATGSDKGFVDETMSYYPLLAGVVAHTAARTVIEVGTHFGGSTLALLAGLRELDDPDAVLITMDVTDLNRKALTAEPEIVKVVGDSTESGFIEGVAAELSAGRRVDLVYIDALKDAGFVLTTLHNLHRAGLQLRWLILDDISVNESMRSLWDLLAREAPGGAYLLSAERPDIRNPKYGYAIIDLDASGDLVARIPALIDSLGLDSSHLDMTRPGERFAAVRAIAAPSYAERCPDAPAATRLVRQVDTAHELARAHVAPHGDVVAFGSEGVMVRALAEGLARSTTVRDPRRRIHAYRSPQESVDDFHAAVGPRGDLVNACAVELHVAGWCGRPISLVVADAVKSPRGFAQLFAAFGPSMMVGSTVLMSTDAMAPYRLFQAYGLAYLADHFEVLATSDVGIVLGYTRQIQAESVHRLVEDRFAASERVDLVHAFSARLDADGRSGMLAQAVRIALRADDSNRVQSLMDELDRLPAPDTKTARARLEKLRDKVAEGRAA